MKTGRGNGEDVLTLGLPHFATASCPTCTTSGQHIRLVAGRQPAVIGHYQIIRLLGGGGEGRVYLGRDIDGRRLAIKVVASDPGVENLAHEAAACAAVDHRNVVRVFACGRHGPLAYLALEHIVGLTFGQLVRRTGPLQASLAAEYGWQAACGLARLHAAGWVHRDVKPANLMHTPSGRVKLIDLGAAGRMDGAIRPPVGWGTMPYLAPELARRPDLADPRSDIYGLGAVLYYLLTGRPPGPIGTDAGLLLWALTADARPAPRLGRNVPSGLAAIVRWMLAPNPIHRTPSAAMVADRLADWIPTVD